MAKAAVMAANSTVKTHGSAQRRGNPFGCSGVVSMRAGRVHLYKGRSLAEVPFAVRTLGLAGVETLILACAAGGIVPGAAPGSLMVFSHHLDFQGSSPLVGPHDSRWG